MRGAPGNRRPYREPSRFCRSSLLQPGWQLLLGNKPERAVGLWVLRALPVSRPELGPALYAGHVKKKRAWPALSALAIARGAVVDSKVVPLFVS